MTHDEFEERALQALAAARLEPLPEGLHEALMDAARTSEARGRVAARTSWLSFVTAAFQMRPAYALGGAVAAGIAIGALGLALVLGSSGALHATRNLAPGTTASLPPAMSDAAVTQLDRGGSHVELTTRREGEGLIVRVDARGADHSELTLTWDPAQLRLGGVRFETSSSPAFETEPGRARLPIPLATGCELSLSGIAPGGSAVHVTLMAPDGREDGQEEETLRLPQ